MPPPSRPPQSVLDSFPVARRVGAFLQHLPKPLVLVICYALLLFIAWVDYNSTPLHLTLVVYYLLPIFLVAWFAGPVHAVIIAVICGLLNLLIDLHYLNDFPSGLWPIVNDLVAAFIYIVTARIIGLVRALIRVEQVLARTDPMTGAANRRAFFEMVEHELYRAHRTAEPLTLVYIDLDDFKLVNDRWGHNTGDTALRIVVATLSKYTRATDLVARLGGDEFAILLRDTDAEEARKVTGKLLREAPQFAIASTTGADAMLTLEFAISGVELRTDIESVQAWLDAADQAMYRHKRNLRLQLYRFDQGR